MVEIKGSAVRDAVAAYQAALPEECRSVIGSLDAETRTLIEEVQPNQWMPMEAFVRYLQAQVDVTGRDPYELHTNRAEIVAERQLRGIYKIFTKLASPRSLVARLSAIHSTYWRGIEVERTLVGDNKVILRYFGFQKEHWLMEPIIVGVFRRMLQVNGAEGVQMQFTVPIGARKDYAELVVTWS